MSSYSGAALAGAPVSASDLCDKGKCPAPTSVEVWLPSGAKLTFCMHHYQQVRLSLPAGGTAVRTTP
jgi:hypothetical protein